MIKNPLIIPKSFVWKMRQYGVRNVFDSYLRNAVPKKVVFLPNVLRIEVTTYCNLKCPTCNYSEFPSDFKRHMSLIELMGITSQVSGVKEVDLTGIGENLINRDFLKMLRYLKERNIRVKFFDNFTLMNRDVTEEIISLEIDEVRASIDGVTKETFETCRAGASFEKVVYNIKEFAKLKKKMGKKTPFFSAGFCLSKLNFKELPLVPDFMSNLGVDCLLIENSIDLGAETTQYNIENDVNTEIGKVAKRCKEIGLILHLNNFSPSPCNALWDSVYITSSGDVIKCPHTKLYYDRGTIEKEGFGNVFHQQFREIWYSEKCRKYRKMISDGILPGDCKKCPFDPML